MTFKEFDPAVLNEYDLNGKRLQELIMKHGFNNTISEISKKHNIESLVLLAIVSIQYAKDRLDLLRSKRKTAARVPMWE